MKNSYQHSRGPAGPEQLSRRGHQPDILRLFEDILRNGTDLRVRVTGRSMRPFLRGGEVLTLRQMPSSSLGKGDLILYRDKNELPVLHRLIQKTKGDDGTFCFLTKGDGLRAFDEEIHEDSVLGKVLRIERPLLSGKTGYIDMNSLFYRCVNFSVAVLGFFKTQTYFFLLGKKAITLEPLAKVFFRHSRGSNRESIYFEKQGKSGFPPSRE